jgi:ABC-type sugar transport system substrate-binding protein
MKIRMISVALASAMLGTFATAASADALGDFKAKVDTAWSKAAIGADVKGLSDEAGPALAKGTSIGAACLGSQLTACVQWWAQLKDIAATTGLQIAEYDGKLDVATWNKELTRAAQAGHAGILVFGGVPSISVQGLTAIAEAKIPLVGMTSDDAPDMKALSSRLDGGIQQDNYDIGYLQGVAAYKLGEGKVHAIGGYDGSDLSIARRTGFEAFVAECAAAGGDCKVTLRQTDTAQMMQQIGQYCSSLALANPDYNVMVTQVDDTTAICVDAVKGAGLLKKGDFGIGVDFNTVGAKRIAPDSDFLASVAAPYSSGAWQGIDELNRILNGQPPLAGRPWVKGIFHPGNVTAIDTKSDTPWDVQLFKPKELYTKLWAIGG